MPKRTEDGNDNKLSLSLSLIVIESQVEKPWKTTRKTPVEKAETEGKMKMQKLNENEAPQKLIFKNENKR